jgi:hypothetical protein
MKQLTAQINNQNFMKPLSSEPNIVKFNIVDIRKETDLRTRIYIYND